MAEVLQVEKRDLLGTANSRRLRNNGLVPVVLYGHKQDTEHLTITEFGDDRPAALVLSFDAPDGLVKTEPLHFR